MKICPKCGISQNDDRTTCVDCGALLPKSLSKDEAYRIEKDRREEISEMAESKEYYHIGPEQKIIIALSIVLILAVAVLSLLRYNGVISPHRPEMMIYVFFLCVCNLICTAFPRVEWFFYSLRFRFFLSESDPEPSDIYISVNRFFKRLFAVLSVMAFIYIF